jgi:hypothetical protein
MKTCCQTAEVYVTRGDVRRIEEHSGRTDFHEFRQPENPIYQPDDQFDDPVWQENVFQPDGSRRVLKREAGGDCTFLGSAGCTLPLEVRPGEGVPAGALAAGPGVDRGARDGPQPGRAMARAALRRAANRTHGGIAPADCCFIRRFDQSLARRANWPYCPPENGPCVIAGSGRFPREFPGRRFAPPLPRRRGPGRSGNRPPA